MIYIMPYVQYKTVNNNIITIHEGSEYKTYSNKNKMKKKNQQEHMNIKDLIHNKSYKHYVPKNNQTHNICQKQNTYKPIEGT